MRYNVVDIATSGTHGLPKNEILEISVVSVDLDAPKHECIEPLYHAVVGSSNGWILQGNPWIFRNSTLTPDDVRNGKPRFGVVGDVRKLLNGCNTVSYDTSFDYVSFLHRKPWKIRTNFPFSIGYLANDVCGNDYEYPSDWCNLDYAYATICDDDPLQYTEVAREKHRTEFDVYRAAFVLRYASETDAGMRFIEEHSQLDHTRFYDHVPFNQREPYMEL